jgi:hypothetical protein
MTRIPDSPALNLSFHTGRLRMSPECIDSALSDCKRLTPESSLIQPDLCAGRALLKSEYVERHDWKGSDIRVRLG